MREAAPSLWQRLWYTRIRDVLRGRFDASLDWRQVVVNAALPSEVAQTITTVVRRTRLWRREKVDVARELVAHFQDGLAAGRTPEQLIESFGDIVLAARLIRRAKKRGRPLAWHVLRWCAIGYVGFSLVYLLFGLYVLTGRPTISTDYLAIVNERANSVPETERAWPLYRAALQQMQVDHQLPKWVGDTELKPGDLEWQDAIAWLESHAAAIEIIRNAAGRRGLGFVVDASPQRYSSLDRQVLNITEPQGAPAVDPAEDRMLVSTLLPQLNAIPSLARLLMIDARRATIQGDGETVLANVRALLGVSRQIEETPFLVNTLVAISIEKMAFATIEEALRTKPQLWTDAQLRDLAHAVAASKLDWKRGFAGERDIFYDILQRIYTDDGQGDGRPVLSGFGIFGMIDALAPVEKQSTHPPLSRWWSTSAGTLVAAPAATMIIASREEMADVYDDFLNGLMERVDRPLWQDGGDPEKELNAKLDGESLARWRYWLVACIAPSLEHVRLGIATRNGLRDGVLVGLALELYHREHGRWPKSLDELSPRWLPEVPVDRISGRPLGLRLVDDRLVVYSIGIDRDDDGGRAPKDDRGRENAYLASPVETADQSHDGDWVIWSTARE